MWVLAGLFLHRCANCKIGDLVSQLLNGHDVAGTEARMFLLIPAGVASLRPAHGSRFTM